MHTRRAENQKPQKAKAVPPQHVLDDTKLFVGTVLAFTLKKTICSLILGFTEPQ
jgi:hypothetical protein